MKWLRRLFCEHSWREVARTRVAPIRDENTLFWITGAGRRAAFVVGFTTILFECGLCHRHRRVEMPGSEPKSPPAPDSRFTRPRGQA